MVLIGYIINVAHMLLMYDHGIAGEKILNTRVFLAYFINIKLMEKVDNVILAETKQYGSQCAALRWTIKGTL